MARQVEYGPESHGYDCVVDGPPDGGNGDSRAGHRDGVFQGHLGGHHQGAPIPVPKIHRYSVVRDESVHMGAQVQLQDVPRLDPSRISWWGTVVGRNVVSRDLTGKGRLPAHLPDFVITSLHDICEKGARLNAFPAKFPDFRRDPTRLEPLLSILWFHRTARIAAPVWNTGGKTLWKTLVENPSGGFGLETLLAFLCGMFFWGFDFWCS